MEINETKRKLIDLITEHQADHPNKKLGVGDLSARAGISRQAFNRYYSDLKDYASGAKPIGDLITNTSSDRTKNLINQNQAHLKNLQQRLDKSEEEYQTKTSKTLDSYITTLMINDITLDNSNEIRTTLERQTLYALELKKQLSLLEIELAHAKQVTSHFRDIETINTGANSEKIKIDIDLRKAFENYANTKSEDNYEDLKEHEITTAVRSIKKTATNTKAHIILFSERYISRFSIFCDRYKCEEGGRYIFVRLPIFDLTSLNSFISQLPPSKSLSIYIPHSESTIEKKAQRTFYFSNVPDYEIRCADQADGIFIHHGFNQVIHYRVRQGD